MRRSVLTGARRMGRATQKGRTPHSGRFTQLHEFMMESRAWRALSPQERAVYIEVARVYNGANNGSLARSVRQLSDLANVNKDTAGRCLARLVEVGFLERVTPGGFSRKTPHAAEWRLTQFRCDKTGAAPAKTFLKWNPENQKPVRDEGQSVRTKGTTPPLNEPDCPKSRDGKEQYKNRIGPPVPDTYTSSQGRSVA